MNLKGNKWVKLSRFIVQGCVPDWGECRQTSDLTRRFRNERDVEWLYMFFIHTQLLETCTHALERPKRAWWKVKAERCDTWLTLKCASQPNHRSVSRERKEALKTWGAGVGTLPNCWLNIKPQRCRNDCLAIRLKSKEQYKARAGMSVNVHKESRSPE